MPADLSTRAPSQADRDAAADYGDSLGIPSADTRAGKCDDSLAVQAFARHAAQAVAAERERCAKRAESVFAGLGKEMGTQRSHNYETAGKRIAAYIRGNEGGNHG